MSKKDRNVILAVVFALLLISPVVFRDHYHTFILNNIVVNIILVMALNFILGFAGQVFLGTVAFFGVACYASGLLTTKLGFTFWMALPASVAITAALSFVLGLPTLKLRGFYLALMSLGFIIVTGDVLKNWTSLTNGVWGVMNIPRPVIAGFPINTNIRFYYLALIIALGLAVLAVLIEDSRFGRAFKVVRDDELAGEVLGINSTAAKLLAFVMCGVYTGVAGSLFASFQQFISPEVYTFDYNSLFMCMLVVGGLSSVPGSVIGASLLTTLTELLRFMRERYLTVYAIIILVMLIYQPGGLVMTFRNLYYWFARSLRRLGRASSVGRTE